MTANTFSQTEWRRFIYPAYPDRPKRLPQLTNDELICAFLATHGVDVRPVGADIRMSRGEAAVMGAAFGLLNPVAWDTMATGAQMKQDARIAARQEWTSWKQWALGHADWAAFKADAANSYQSALEAAQEWENDPANQARFRELVKQGEANTRRLHRNNILLMAAAVGTGILFLAVLNFVENFGVRPDKVTPPIQSSKSDKVQNLNPSTCVQEAEAAGREGGHDGFTHATDAGDGTAWLWFTYRGRTWSTTYICMQ